MIKPTSRLSLLGLKRFNSHQLASFQQIYSYSRNGKLLQQDQVENPLKPEGTAPNTVPGQHFQDDSNVHKAPESANVYNEQEKHFSKPTVNTSATSQFF